MGLINDWINLVLMIVLKECYRPILMYHASYQVREFSNLPRRLFASALGVGRTGGGRRDHKWNWFRKFHSRWWRTFVIGLIHFIIIVLTKLSRIKSGILCRMYTTSITYLTFVEKSYTLLINTYFPYNGYLIYNINSSILTRKGDLHFMSEKVYANQHFKSKW